MKFNSMIRQGMVLAGLTAAMVVLPGTVKAQEITNTEFSDGPNVVAIEQPTANAHEDVTVTMLAPEQAMSANQAIAGAAEGESMTEEEAPRPSAWATFLLTLCVGLIALYTLISADRASRNMGHRVSTRSA